MGYPAPLPRMERSIWRKKSGQPGLRALRARAFSRGDAENAENFLKMTERKSVVLPYSLSFRWNLGFRVQTQTRFSMGAAAGFHRKMRLIQRRAYGFRNFQNYRLRVIAQCG
jgi:hypothetical protein